MNLIEKFSAIDFGAMGTVTIAWIALPFLLGFTIFLLPKLDDQRSVVDHRVLAWLGVFVSAAYAVRVFLEPSPTALQLLDNFGNTLMIDPLAGYFLLTNALVTAAVIFYSWRDKSKSYFFFAQTLLLHGSLNAAFVCTDFISEYVALEVSGIAAFLLIAYPRSDRSLWVALRYLFISNVAMLFYLIGAVLAYQTNHSFRFDALAGAPPEAVALIMLGLLVKGGVFVSGLWLPLTHSEAETPVSALLSGVVVKAGVYPLLRFAPMTAELDMLIRIFGVGTTLLGVFYAMFEKDTKRMLAFHTVSQLGFILAAPEVGGFYALTHGLVKSSLFLSAGNLPSRSFKELQQTTIKTSVWVPLVIASLSISGFPLLAGFGSKVWSMKNLLPWQAIAMNVAAVGTAISFAKFIFLPHGDDLGASKPTKSGYWYATSLLIGGLVFANFAYLQAYTIDSLIKALGTIAIGWLIYWVGIRHVTVKLPRVLEEFEHLVGMMSVVLILLFWMMLSRMVPA